MKIIKQELQFEESLKQRLKFICEFAKVNPTFINGSIRKLDKTAKVKLIFCVDGCFSNTDLVLSMHRANFELYFFCSFNVNTTFLIGPP